MPDLATSLNNLGNRLAELERHEDALGALREAVGALEPALIQVPHAHGLSMTTIVAGYLAACTALGREPDHELLRPIAAALEALRPTDIAAPAPVERPDALPAG